jgi:hypothetical protein
MPHPAWALESAVLAVLKADPALLARLGGQRVYDAVPPKTAHPFLAYGPHTVRDWSTGDGPGCEHFVTLRCASREPGFRHASELAEAATAALLGSTLALDGHRLVLFRHDATELRRESDGVTSTARVTFRALTEPM